MSETILRIREAATAELVPNRNVRRIVGVAAFALATAFGAHVAIPMTPVPVTLQTLVVLLSGALLGPALGASAQMAYLAMGISGMPVFSGGGFGLAHLLGPTGGYLLAFPVTAFLAGHVARRVPRRGLAAGLGLLVGLFVASLATLLGGTAWLGVLSGDMGTAFVVGFLPFLIGDVIKVSLATLIVWRGRERTLRLS